VNFYHRSQKLMHMHKLWLSHGFEYHIFISIRRFYASFRTVYGIKTASRPILLPLNGRLGNNDLGLGIQVLGLGLDLEGCVVDCTSSFTRFKRWTEHTGHLFDENVSSDQTGCDLSVGGKETTDPFFECRHHSLCLLVLVWRRLIHITILHVTWDVVTSPLRRFPLPGEVACGDRVRVRDWGYG